MAKSSHVIDVFSNAAGFQRVTIGHTARLLREANGDLWPISGKGGGKNLRHVEPRHAANLMLSLAGAQPSNAPTIVAELGAARWMKEGRANRPAADAYTLSARRLLASRDGGRPRDLALRQMVESLIQTVATSKTAVTLGRQSKWTLWLNSSLGSAWTSWTFEGREYRDHYAPAQPHLFTAAEQRSFARAQRVMMIPFNLVVVAAELCADTIARHAPVQTPAAADVSGSTRLIPTLGSVQTRPSLPRSQLSSSLPKRKTPRQ